MNVTIKLPKESSITIILCCPCTGSKQAGIGEIPQELQVLIKCCTTIEELKELLFSTDFIKNEAVMNAFDKHFEQLEPA